jgi:hypothetical protein
MKTNAIKCITKVIVDQSCELLKTSTEQKTY